MPVVPVGVLLLPVAVHLVPVLHVLTLTHVVLSHHVVLALSQLGQVVLLKICIHYAVLLP